MRRRYTWKKQKPDIRDYKISKLVNTGQIVSGKIPDHVNLRRWCSYVEDQGMLGSCTAQAWSSLLEYNQNKYRIDNRPYVDLSRIFIYYNERVLEGTVNEDSGASLRSGARVIKSLGVCPEYQLPYNIDEFANKPSDRCYQSALNNTISGYYSLHTLDDLKLSLANGLPFVFGFLVFDSFESHEVASNGIVPMPDMTKEDLLGGHAVLAVGYNEKQKRFLVKNSWGTDWGLKNADNRGYFTIPYEYISNPFLAGDFWTVVV